MRQVFQAGIMCAGKLSQSCGTWNLSRQRWQVRGDSPMSHTVPVPRKQHRLCKRLLRHCAVSSAMQMPQQKASVFQIRLCPVGKMQMLSHQVLATYRYKSICPTGQSCVCIMYVPLICITTSSSTCTAPCACQRLVVLDSLGSQLP